MIGMLRVLCLAALVGAAAFWLTEAFLRRGPAPGAKSAWQAAGPGIEARFFRTKESGVSTAAVRAPAGRVRIAGGALLDAGGWRERERALFAVNGGFFDEDGRSLGLRVSGGRRLSRFLHRDWGVFLIRDGRAGIVHSRDYRADRRITQAVQCGPRLVVEGRPLRMKPQSARRTGIGVQRDGRVVLAVSEEPLSLAEWARVWAAPDGLNCREALNLDGGPSTQLSLEAGRHRRETRGAWPVPDAIVVR